MGVSPHGTASHHRKPLEKTTLCKVLCFLCGNSCNFSFNFVLINVVFVEPGSSDFCLQKTKALSAGDFIRCWLEKCTSVFASSSCYVIGRPKVMRTILG